MSCELEISFFQVTEQPTYAPFEFPKPQTTFNGFSYMKFDADINAVTIRGGASVNTKSLGSWTAGLNNELKINAVDDMRNLTANIVYRIYTVVQPPFIIRDENAPKGFKGRFAASFVVFFGIFVIHQTMSHFFTRLLHRPHRRNRQNRAVRLRNQGSRRQKVRKHGRKGRMEWRGSEAHRQAG